MFKSLKGHSASRRRIKENFGENQNSQSEKQANDSLVNCDNKTNHCNRYLSDALLSGQNRSKLSIDDESSHPINGSNTNNKSERKRNINMLNDEDRFEGDGMGIRMGKEGDSQKRMKVDGNADGQDNNKTKMYQVSMRMETERNFPAFPFFSFSFFVLLFDESFEMYLIVMDLTKIMSLEINFLTFSY